MKTVTVFLGVNMGWQHLSLIKLAKEKGIDLTNMNTGEAVVFINRRKNKMKAYSYNGVLSYIRFDNPQRPLDMDSIEQFPKAFDSNGVMSYPKALKATLEKKMNVRRYEKLEII